MSGLRSVFPTFLILLCTFSTLHAQLREIRFEHLSVDQGLSQGSITAIFQDQWGFMWFGTQEGLNRYDGHDFRVFRFDPADTTSLSGNYVSAIHQDSRQRLWVGTEGDGLNRMNPSGVSFVRYSNNPRQPGSLSNNFVTAIYTDSREIMWVGTRSGLNRYDAAADTFSVFYPNPRDPEQNVIVDVIADTRGILWVTTRFGIYIFDNEQEGFTPLSFGFGVDFGDGIRCSLIDHGGLVWFATFGEGVYQCRRNGELVASFKSSPENGEGLTSNFISDMAEDSFGRIWIATWNAGVFLLNPETRIFQRFSHEPYKPWSLSSNIVAEIYQGSGETLWFGTSGKGVDKFDRYRLKFHLIQNTYQNPDALRGDFIWSIFEDIFGDYWIGTQSGGLNRYDPDIRRFRVFQHSDSDPASISSNLVYAITAAEDGRIWVGTGFGLNKLDPETGRFTRYHHRADDVTSLSHNTVRALSFDRAGNLWVGTAAGLDEYDPLNDCFRRYSATLDSSDLPFGFVNAITQSRSGHLLVGTSRGLVIMDPDRGLFRRLSGENSGLANDRILSICEDEKGLLWLGSLYGLHRVDPLQNTVRTFTVHDGLPNNVVYGILSDDSGNLWMSTNKGLSRFNPETGAFRNFDIDDGLQSREFNGGAYFRNRNGKMFFGGVNGFNIFHPDSIRDNPNRPPVVITALKRYDKTMLSQFELARTESVSLSWRDDFISFEFAALNYANPAKNRFAYLLEGFNEEWIDCGHQRYATFTNLDPGEYTFRVRAANNDGVWNEEGAHIRLVITPPFWQRLWFRILAIAAIIVLLLAFVRQQGQREKKKAEIDRRIAELKMQALRAQMNPHFIFNTLNSIQYFISKNDQNLAYTYLSKFSRLLRMILESSDKSRQSIADEIHALKLYLELEMLRFEGKFSYNLDIDPELDVHNAEIPTLLIQPFVENAIQHGLRFKRSKGNLSIMLRKKENALICTIEDNGIGIEKARNLKETVNGHKKSIGISITQERLETLNAVRRNGKSIEISDLSSEGSRGTKVRIVIPLETSDHDG